MAKANIQGWHFQSDRHRRARKFGRAGGSYKTTVGAILAKHPEYKKLSYRQLRNKGVMLKYDQDADKDGVKNGMDCKPFNKKKQDDPIQMTEESYQKFLDKQVPEETKSKIEPTPIKKKSRLKRFEDEVIKDAKIVGKEAYKDAGIIAKKLNEKSKEVKKRIDEELEKRQAEKELERKNADEMRLQSINHVLKPHNQVEKEEDINLTKLSDEELKKLAIITPRNIFGADNRYEYELKRRIDASYRLQTDLALEKKKAHERESSRLTKETTKKKDEGYVPFWK